MRIIGGKLGGRKFNPQLSKWPTRPTTDQAREGLFNILHHSIDLEGITVLDLFGGSGSITFEFCSRGCKEVVYVDKYTPCIRYVQSQIQLFGIEDQVKVIRKDVFKYLKRAESIFDLVFCDPPYAMQQLKDLPDLIWKSGVLKSGGMLIIEHDASNDFEMHKYFVKMRKYGDSIFSFFRASE